MRAFAFSLAIGVMAVWGYSTAQAGDSSKKSQSIAEVTVEQADKKFKAKKAVPVDANGQSTRESRGVVPGAILLTSSGQFDAAKELPKDKNTELVFYCANTMCHASDGAAARAQKAGYQNVKVMRDGIKGWAAAGKKVDKPKKKS